jgi:uncharacterized protein YjbI with pentapeptide repeats
MTDLSIRKKKKITITASSEGIKRAEKALIRGGFESKFNFAETQPVSRSTVTKFFQCKPIQLDSFKIICQGLKLEWSEIAELPEEKKSRIPEINDCLNPDINEGVDKMLTPTFSLQVTLIDKKANTLKAEMKLIGDIKSLEDVSSVELNLREIAGDTIKIIDIKEGSIRLTVEGSQEDIDRLVSRIKSGELKEVSGFPVADVQILSESSEDDESNELNNKWCLVREIVTQGFRPRNLSGIDLSDADLSGANLSFADLRSADLSGADLSGANLMNAKLSDADLSGADLSGAGLSGADLNSADLNSADLNSAKLIYAYLIRAYLRGADLIDANLIGANLSGANLSGANLSGANLSGANLIGANLSGANLRSAHLSGAHLNGANLSVANLSVANLSGADLSGANLIDANLSKTKVKEARFTSNLGISEAMKRDLIKQGAIFEDSPGDRSEVPTKV